ncbi:DUF4153 domain-containing protein [Actinoplanes couchii]|uniref:DUF4153 domain-containing protein n=1 Tax=Actinoplanes couchii TaxID=403638 RepID=UPI0035A25D5A
MVTARVTGRTESVPAATLRGLAWLRKGGRRDKDQPRGAGTPGRVLATLTVTFVLLGVFGALFASADAAFARFVEAAIPDLDTPRSSAGSSAGAAGRAGRADPGDRGVRPAPDDRLHRHVRADPPAAAGRRL